MSFFNNAQTSFPRRILKQDPPIPDNLSPATADFISKLLVKDPRKRLGGGPSDAQELKEHPFFDVRPRHKIRKAKI